MHPKYYTIPQFKPFVAFVREGDDGGGSGGAGAPDIEKIVAERVAREVAGLKAKNEELLGKNAQYRDQVKQFEGVDVAKYREFQQQLDNNEDMKLITEGKTTELVQKYTERMRKEHEAKLAEVQAAVEAERQRGKKYEQAVLDNHIRQACVGMHPSAIEDALLHGRTIFSLDAEGRAVKLDDAGRLEIGKDGSSPFSPAEWIESQKELKPHWFPATSSGSGSSGSSAAGAGAGKTMPRSKFDTLSPSEQAKVAMSGTKIVD
jgi:hypothetical protein